MADKTGTEAIEFEAIVSQVRTMADGGLRFVLDVAEGHVYEAAWMMQAKETEGTINVTVALHQD